MSDKELAKAAAEEAVRSFACLVFEIDIDDTEEMKTFRRDMRFMHELRKASEHTRAAIWKSVVTIMIGGVAVAMWKGLPWGGLTK